ncbi:MAG: hypothetical protein K0R14_148 [Burkholderiales bacterium]|jgi:hypothetical protein|nr:hypothetical protein [Burkholderiales bacterium]
MKCKFNYFLCSILVLLYLPVSSEAIEQIGKCYLTVVLDKAPETGEPIQPTLYPLQNCIFAWRLQDKYTNRKYTNRKYIKYILNTTAGVVAQHQTKVTAGGSLYSAAGPLHLGTSQVEWSITKNNNGEDLWTIIVNGILSSDGMPYFNDKVFCESEKVKNGTGFDYADGCSKYNYYITGSKPWGYLDLTGDSSGGPIQPKAQEPAPVTTSSSQSTPSCNDKEHAVIVHTGQTCDSKSGQFKFNPNAKPFKFEPEDEGN